MAIRVALNHKTEYHYDRPVTLLPQVVRLRPAPHCRTPILSYSLKITPEEHFLNWQQDPYSNYLARLVFPEPTREFAVEVDLVAEMTAINPFDFFIESVSRKYPVRLRADAGQGTDSVSRKRAGRPAAAADVSPSCAGEKIRTNDYLVDINQRLQRDIRYVIRLEPGIRRARRRSRKGSGSCRDTAWLLVQILRHLGLAARFVSGYLIQLTADVKALDGPSGPDRKTSPICTPGPKSICPAPAGSASIRLRACSPAKGTFRWPAPPIRPAPRRSPGHSNLSATRRSAIRTTCTPIFTFA